MGLKGMNKIFSIKSKYWLLPAALLWFTATASAQPEAGAITGVWLEQSGEGYVQIFQEQDLFHGQIVGAPEDSPRRDDDGKSLLGNRILKNFTYDGDGLWHDGTVYDPDKDKTYTSKMWLEDENTLKIRGYVGVSLLGRTVVWTRANRDAPGVVQEQLK